MKNLVIISLAVFLFLNTTKAQETGTFTEPRDNRTYKTVSYENYLLGSKVTWMAENLDYKMTDGCWAYDNNEQYRKRLGLLYNYISATKACPVGWHLPSISEWTYLEGLFGGGEKAVLALKNDKGWIKSRDGNSQINENGNNSSKFSALPSGFYRANDKTFSRIGDMGAWWTNTIRCEGAYKNVALYSYSSKISHNSDMKNGCSIRCVKD